MASAGSSQMCWLQLLVLLVMTASTIVLRLDVSLLAWRSGLLSVPGSLARSDTVKCKEPTVRSREKLEHSPKHVEYARRKLEKKQKLLERAKSLSDMTRIHIGYARTKPIIDSIDSESSVSKFHYI